MTATRTSSTLRIDAQAFALMLLVGLTLAPTLLGRAGFQIVERGVAARIFPLHQHGVAGEAEYIRRHRAPAPFVHHHCHGTPDGAEQQTTPAEFAAGALLFSPVLCETEALLPAAPAVTRLLGHDAEQPPLASSPQPLTPPPQV